MIETNFMTEIRAQWEQVGRALARLGAAIRRALETFARLLSDYALNWRVLKRELNQAQARRRRRGIRIAHAERRRTGRLIRDVRRLTAI
jgi:hypothetical protein